MTVKPADTVEINDNPVATGPIEAKAGDKVSFQCEASATPQPTIAWYKNGARVVESSRVVVSDNGNRLTVNKFEDGDAGVYSCSAGNAAGQTISAVGVQGQTQTCLLLTKSDII